MKSISLLTLILLAGCSQPASKQPAPIIGKPVGPEPVPPALIPPVIQTSSMRTALVRPMSNAPVLTPAFAYPTDALDYTWSLQVSTDMVHWQTICNHMQGAASGTMPVTAPAAAAFWRMKGDKL